MTLETRGNLVKFLLNPKLLEPGVHLMMILDTREQITLIDPNSEGSSNIFEKLKAAIAEVNND